MGYVIAAIVVLLIVAGFITFLVLNSMRKGSAKSDEGAPGVGSDETPLGDTTELAGRHAESGETTDQPEDGEGPPRPARPEDRQLRDAGARE
jgi:hypothetical protein